MPKFNWLLCTEVEEITWQTIRLYKRDIQSVTFQRVRGLHCLKKNVRRPTKRKDLVVEKVNSLFLTLNVPRKQDVPPVVTRKVSNFIINRDT
jgi:hypothetical protein